MTKIRDLVVFPLLSVHRIQVEPKRVRATYTVVSGDGSRAENELIYSYSQLTRRMMGQLVILMNTSRMNGAALPWR